MVDPERKLLGCLVEKSGSSSWHKVFWELREPSTVFVPSEAYAKNFKFAATVGDNVWSEAMNDPTWIRFVTVRHPLARLYSGWNRFVNYAPALTQFQIQKSAQRRPDGGDTLLFNEAEILRQRHI